MKTIRIHETGGPEVMQLDEIEVPKPGQGEVLVKVAVAGVNFTDIMQRQGVYMSRADRQQTPFILGVEIAGTVVATGPDVTTPAIGTRVISLVRGGYAEYAVADVREVVAIPDSLDFTHAIAFLVQGITAYQLLQDATHLEPGESVLIHSAAGGVGTLAVQIAKAHGAGKVIATTGSRDKGELARSLGADVIVDYRQDNWVEEVRAATDGKGVDVILEAVGGEIAEQSIACLGPFGRMAIYGVASTRFASFAGTQLMHDNQAIVGYWLTTWLQRREKVAKAQSELIRLASENRLHPVVRNVFPLAKAAEAHQAIMTRNTVGKVVLVT
jgi:NADPH2:quinone reductase